MVETVVRLATSLQERTYTLVVLTRVGITNCQITYIARFWMGNGYGNPRFSGEIQGEETLG